MADTPKQRPTFEEAASKLVATATAELRKRGFTDAEIQSSLKTGKPPKRPRDANQLAKRVADLATGNTVEASHAGESNKDG